MAPYCLASGSACHDATTPPTAHLISPTWSSHTACGAWCGPGDAPPSWGSWWRTPWSDLGELLTSEVITEALRLSLISSLAAAALSLVLGVPLAWILARYDFPGRALVRALVIMPMVLPPVVGGAALLFALGRRGLVGEPLYDATGFLLPFSIWGVIVATTFIALPFLVLTVEGGLRNLDQRYEAAAATLGARRWTVFRKITLPLIGPALASGIVLAWARALGEFGATVTFAGNLQGRTQTMPLRGVRRTRAGPGSRHRIEPRPRSDLAHGARAPPRSMVARPMSLDARLLVQRNAGFRLDASLTVEPGETVALLGPNGAGKSTAVSALAGIVPLDSGHVTLDGRVLDDPARDVFVPPEDRHVGVVFQDYLLFPHMSVIDNVVFALRNQALEQDAG